jgi:hypothetical protein
MTRSYEPAFYGENRDMQRQMNKRVVLSMALLVLLLVTTTYAGANYYKTAIERHPYGTFIGGLVGLLVVLALIIVVTWFSWKHVEEDRAEAIGIGIMCTLFLLFFGTYGMMFMWEGGKNLGVWESALAGKIVVSVIIPAASALLVFGVRAMRHYLEEIPLGYSSPFWATIFTGFLLISVLWLAGHVFADLEKAIVILPPIPLLIAYLIVGAIISIKFEPEISGNIIIDAGLVSVACHGVGFLLSMGFWMWLVSLPRTSPDRVRAWVTTWMAASFVIRCLISEKEDNKESIICSRSFMSRLWAAVPFAMLGLVIVGMMMKFIDGQVADHDPKLRIIWADDVSRTFVVLLMPVVVAILLRRTRRAVKPPGGGAVASIARGFGYGLACLCIVSAGIGAYLGYFIILTWWVLVIGVLLCGIIVYGRDELTGNSPLDGLLMAAFIIALAHAVVSGALCAVELELLSSRVFWIWLLGSLVIGLAIRVFHWATE